MEIIKNWNRKQWFLLLPSQGRYYVLRRMLSAFFTTGLFLQRLWICYILFPVGRTVSEQLLRSAGARCMEEHESATRQSQEKCLFTKSHGSQRRCAGRAGTAPLGSSQLQVLRQLKELQKTLTCFSSLIFLFLNMQEPAVPQTIDSLMRVEKIPFVLMLLFCATGRSSVN